MKKLWLAVVLLVGGACRAQDKRADEIMRRAEEAMGGLERIHALHSLVNRGFHYEGSYQQEYIRTKSFRYGSHASGA
jgi:hypothetical protein